MSGRDRLKDRASRCRLCLSRTKGARDQDDHRLLE